MTDTVCPTCLNLDYGRFGQLDDYANHCRPRYLAIEFDELRAAALAGCPICTILNQGCSLFWGSTPETKNCVIRNDPSFLFLKRSLGMGLLASRLPAQSLRRYWEFYSGDSIEFFTQPANNIPIHPAFGHANSVPLTSTATNTASMLRSWLEACDDNHELCRDTPLKPEAPSRMLSIGMDTLQLVEFPSGQGLREKYATMSHCWGTNEHRPTMTTKENIKFRKEGINLEELSPLFQDAVRLCRMVGCYFLWIDSLCIIQEDTEDWREQSQNMTAIYSNAYFNIAATFLQNSSQSLFQRRWVANKENRRWYKESELTAPESSGRSVFVRNSHDDDHINVQGSPLSRSYIQAPLLTRAWVLQEILLARRTLHICASEVIWECKTTYTCECGSIPYDTHEQRPGDKSEMAHQLTYMPRKQEFARVLLGDGASRQDSYDLWLQVAEEYSRLYLTNPSDRFFAAVGIAQSVQKMTNSVYLAGSWAGDLLRSLLWFTNTKGDVYRTDDAPTWSWMSLRVQDGLGITSKVDYTYVLYLGLNQEPRTSVHWPGLLEYGSPSRLWPMARDQLAIEVEGPVALFRVSLYVHGALSNEPRKGDVRLCAQPVSGEGWKWLIIDADCPKSLLELDPEMKPYTFERSHRDPGLCVEGIIMGTNNKGNTYVLLVRKDGEGEGEGEHYKRVGIVLMRWVVDNPDRDHDDLLEVAEVKKILLI